MTVRVWHNVIAGDAHAAVEHGLTLKAKCGAVWIPVIHASPSDRPDIQQCADCYPVVPHFVYHCLSAVGDLLYVGCTSSPTQRGQAHKKNSWWFPQVSHTRLIIFPSKERGLAVEAKTIREEFPLWNVRGVQFDELPADEVTRRFNLAIHHDAPEKIVRRYSRLALKNHGLSLEVAS